MWTNKNLTIHKFAQNLLKRKKEERNAIYLCRWETWHHLRGRIHKLCGHWKNREVNKSSLCHASEQNIQRKHLDSYPFLLFIQKISKAAVTMHAPYTLVDTSKPKCQKHVTFLRIAETDEAYVVFLRMEKERGQRKTEGKGCEQHSVPGRHGVAGNRILG